MPIGIAVVLMTLHTLRGRETHTERRRIDAVGLALLVIGIGSLQIMLDRGKELDWFSSQEIIILTVVAVIAISFLIVWELTDDHPIVDLSLNRVTSRLAACASALPICSISAPLFYCRSFCKRCTAIPQRGQVWRRRQSALFR